MLTSSSHSTNVNTLSSVGSPLWDNQGLSQNLLVKIVIVNRAILLFTYGIAHNVSNEGGSTFQNKGGPTCQQLNTLTNIDHLVLYF